MAKAFGEQNPTAGEDAVSWQTWSDGAAGIPDVDGNADWGKLKLDYSGEEGRSAVYDLGSEKTRTLTLTRNRYGMGDDEPTLQIRGRSTTFNQDDDLPTWETYSAAISRTWRYAQVRATTSYVPFLDYFDRADGSVGNGWTAPNAAISSNDVVISPTGDANSKFVARSYAATNMIANVCFTVGGTNKAGVVVNLDDPANPLNYVIAKWQSATTVRLSKFVGGAETAVQTTTVNIDPGEMIEIRKSGTTYQIWYRGAQVGTDQTIEGMTGTYVGFYSDGNDNQFHSFSVRENGTDYPVRTDLATLFSGKTYTAGQGIISLRFDDNQSGNYGTIYPMLTARGLVAGFATQRKLLGGTSVLNAQLLTMQANGMEIMCHARNVIASPSTWAEWKSEVPEAVAEQWLTGLNVAQFSVPGGWSGSPYWIDSVEDYGTDHDLWMREFFRRYDGAIVDFDETNAWHLPRTVDWGVDAVAGDTWTLANLQSLIDSLITNGWGSEVHFHYTSIGDVGKISMEDFTAFLDYIETKVGLGGLKCLTPTEQIFATQAA